jgi:hypothetical protein
LMSLLGRIGRLGGKVNQGKGGFDQCRRDDARWAG